MAHNFALYFKIKRNVQRKSILMADGLMATKCLQMRHSFANQTILFLDLKIWQFCLLFMNLFEEQSECQKSADRWRAQGKHSSRNHRSTTRDNQEGNRKRTKRCPWVVQNIGYIRKYNWQYEKKILNGKVIQSLHSGIGNGAPRSIYSRKTVLFLGFFWHFFFK